MTTIPVRVVVIIIMVRRVIFFMCIKCLKCNFLSITFIQKTRHFMNKANKKCINIYSSSLYSNSDATHTLFRPDALASYNATSALEIKSS